MLREQPQSFTHPSHCPREETFLPSELGLDVSLLCRTGGCSPSRG